MQSYIKKLSSDCKFIFYFDSMHFSCFFLLTFASNGLPYAKAELAIKLINDYAEKQVVNESLSELIRSYWQSVYAHISTQSVAVSVDNLLQVYELNVILAEQGLEILTQNKPFLLKSAEEKNACIEALNKKK